jgi:lysylphosphatidylglycerol synthetase-like protein (DUF2156 family)
MNSNAAKSDHWLLPLIRRYASQIIAFLILLSGIFNLVSVSRTISTSIFDRIDEIYKFSLTNTSKIVTVVIGILLVSTARGLLRRNKDAWKTAVILTSLSIFFHLLKGFNYEEGVVSTAILVILILNKNLYTRDSKYRLNIGFLKDFLIAMAIFALYYLIGTVLLSKQFIHNVSKDYLFKNFLYDTFSASSNTLVPITSRALWFERSVSAVFIVIIVYFLIRLFNSYISQDATADFSTINKLVKKYGADSLDYFSTNYKKAHYFNPDIEGVIAYTVKNKIAFASGDPITSNEQFPAFLQSFRQAQASKGLSTAFIGTSSRHKSLYKEAGYKIIKIGEEAIVNIQSYNLEKDYPGKSGWKFRRAVRHISDEGINFEMHSIQTLPSSYYSQMVEINNEWIKTFGGGKERGFSMTLSRLPNESDIDCKIACALSFNENVTKLVGYIVFAPIYNGNGYSLDVMRRRDDCPNGLNEFLIVKSIESFKVEGFENLSLNFAPLAESSTKKVTFLGKIKDYVLSGFSGLYYLDSLYFFNQKFHPRWESRYLVFEKVSDIPNILLAVANLEGAIELDLNVAKRLVEVIKIWKKID